MNSSFKFQITQTTKVLLYKIEQGNGKRWNLSYDNKKGEIYLQDVKATDLEVVTTISLQDNAMRIVCSRSNYEYIITDKAGDGANVVFTGPINALLMQSLMPRMNYVPKTLVGKTEEMEEYLPILEYMKDRAKHNSDAEKLNPQDKHGYRVNSRFYNELVPYLPESHEVRHYKKR